MTQTPARASRAEGMAATDFLQTERQEKRARVILSLLVFLPCLVMVLALDNDLWFLLNSGRYVLENGIPTIEPFTLHQNFRFLMQQWLSAVLYWCVYSRLGAAGVLALLFAVYCATVAVLYKLARYLSQGNAIAAFLAALLASAALKLTVTSRPIVFTLLVLSVELYLLERFTGTAKPRYLLALPALSALLINLHAAMWPIQFVLLLPYMIDAFRFRFWIFRGQGYPKRYFFPAVALMFAAGFLNPYGWSAMSYLFRSYGYQEIGIVLEMQPPNINHITGMMIFGFIFLVAAIYLLKKNRETRLRYALLTLGTIVLTLSSIRSFSIFALCAMFPLAYLLKDVSLPKGKIHTGKGILRLRAVLIAAVVVTVSGLLSQRVSAFVRADQTPAVAQAVHYLKENEPQEDMVLYTGYNEGGFAEYMGLKPYIDPRAEVFVKKNNGAKDVMLEYYRLQVGQEYYKSVLDEYGFTHLIVSQDDILSADLPHDDDYTCVYDDGEYAVYRHR